MKTILKLPVTKTAIIFLTSVLKTFLTTLLQDAVKFVLESKKSRIIPRQLFLAIHNSEPLSLMCQNVVIARGG